MHWNVAPDALLDLQGLYVFWTAGLTIGESSEQEQIVGQQMRKTINHQN